MAQLEVLKTQDNITVKHDSQHYDYVQNRIQLNEFLKEDGMREGNLKLSREHAQQALIGRYGFGINHEVPNEVPVEQTELSYKEKKKQQKQHKKLLERTHKQYPMGTEDTLNIVSQHTEQVAARNAKMAEVRKPGDRLSEDSQKRLALVAELESYMREENKAVSPLMSVRMGEMIKKYDESFVNKLTPEYIRRNYTEIKQEMDKINCIAQNIQIGELEPQILQEVNGRFQRTSLPYNFVEFANECKVLYNNALISFGLKVNEENGELVAVTPDDRAVIQSRYGNSLYKLKRMFSKNNVKRDIKDDLSKYEDFLAKTEQEMDRLHDNGEDITQIESLLFKARDEMCIIKAIRDNYNNPGNLTEEQRQYANMHYAIEDEAYKEDKKAKIHLLRDIENDTYSEVTDVENVKAEINALANRIYSDMSVEELEEHRRELYIVSTSILRDGITTYADTALNELKVSKIISLANKLRAADILAGIRTDSITLDDLTKQERNSIINNTEGEITELDIAEYAKKMHVIAEKTHEYSMNSYMLSESARQLSEQRGKDRYNEKEIADKSNHKNVSTQIIEYAKKYLYLTDEDMKNTYNDLKTKLNEMISLKEKAEDSAQIEKEIDQISEQMTYLQILYRLKLNKYSVYGDKNAPYVAAIFRGMGSYEYGEFADMSDEEFLNMAKKLSAGTFENDVDEDTKEQYVKNNMEGLNILKEKSIARYKRLYEKYGLRTIDMDYVQEHYFEIKKDFSFTQDDEQQYAIKGVLNENSDNDMMLLHLVKFYSDISYIAIGALNTQITGQGGYNAYKQNIKTKWSESTNEHYTYLKEREGDILKL